MRVIHKYVVEVGSENRFRLHSERTLLLVGRDPRSGHPAIWFEEDTDSSIEFVIYHIYGTGEELNTNIAHIGTAICENFVWHIYKEIQ